MLKREKMSWLKILGIGMAVIGTLIMVQVEKLFSQGASSKSMIGNLMLLGNSLCFSIYLVKQKPLVDEYPFPMALIGWVFLFGGTIICIAALFFVKEFIEQAASMPILGWVNEKFKME